MFPPIAPLFKCGACACVFVGGASVVCSCERKNMEQQEEKQRRSCNCPGGRDWHPSSRSLALLLGNGGGF
jgi:hypothetical protein